MTIHFYTTLAAALTTVLMLKAHAADTTITVYGNVKTSSCTTGGNASYSIDLGQNLTQTDLAIAGSSTPWVTQDVVISGCPTGIHTVTATFAGKADSLNPSMYANSSGTGFSEHVAVQLQETLTSTDVGNTSKLAIKTGTTSQVTFPLRARLYTSNGGVTAGLVTAAVTMNISYN